MCVFVGVYAHVRVFLCVGELVCVHVYVCVFACVCVCVCVRVDKYLHGRSSDLIESNRKVVFVRN